MPVTFTGDTNQYWAKGGGSSPDRLALAPRFVVEVDGALEASFSECSGLTVTIRNDKWEEGGDNATTLKFPGRTDFGNVTLKHGVSFSADLFDWFVKVMEGKKDRRSITIKLVTQDLDVLRSWNFTEAFPVKWTGPTLQATSNTIGIEAIEFAYNGMTKVR